MKCLLIVFFAAAAVAEPPVYSARYSTVSRQGPAEFRPLGVQFARQEVPQVYYIPPDFKYNPAGQGGEEATATTEADVGRATTEANFNITREPEAEEIHVASKSAERLSEGGSFSQQGTYYIYHPSGLLQKIVYATKNDVENMGFTARLRYQDVEPIREPIYTYDPNTFVLQPLEIWIYVEPK